MWGIKGLWAKHMNMYVQEWPIKEEQFLTTIKANGLKAFELHGLTKNYIETTFKHYTRVS